MNKEKKMKITRLSHAGLLDKTAISRFIIIMTLGLFLLNALSVSAQDLPNVPAQDPPKTESGFDTTEALIELLQKKGVINQKEATGFLKRHKDQLKSTGKVVTIQHEDNQEEYLKRISKGVTSGLTEDLNNLKQRYEFRSNDLVKKTIVLEREIARLEDMLTEEYKPQLQKSSWAQRIRFGGDIRLRHESTLFDEDNATDIADVNNPGENINTTKDRHRERIRLRLGVKAKILDPSDVNVGKVEAGIRLASGSVNNPVSTNHTLGSSGDSKSDLVLDRAYLKWTFRPREEIFGDMIPEISFTGGIMKNPWVSMTSLVWDSDLAFEGYSVNFQTDTNEMNPFSAFTTIGYFPLEEAEFIQSDKFMVGGQIGFKHRPTYGWDYQLAAAYFGYENVEGRTFTNTTQTDEDDRWLALLGPKYWQKGNSFYNMDQRGLGSTTYGLLSDFDLLNFSAKLDYSGFFPIHVVLYGDYVKNLSYDAAAMAKKSGSDTATIEGISGDTGYQFGIKVGHPKPRERWAWNISLEYRYLESDAVMASFTDSDFHLGGTNARGFILGGELALYQNVWLAARWMSANEIDDMEQSSDQTDDLSVDTFQINLNAEF